MLSRVVAVVKTAFVPPRVAFRPVMECGGRALCVSAEVPANRLQDDKTYHLVADDMLEGLEAALDEALGHLEECDVNNAQGVLTLSLGHHGTYVINKQAPNHQLWWSSPVSGPKRFYLNAESGRWCNTRDDTDMLHALQEELSNATGAAVKLDVEE